MGKEYLIGDFLKRIKRPITLSPNKEYKLVTIKMNHKGVVLRGLKKGGEIKSNMYEVKEGDFILSGIDARYGAFGIIPKELDGAIVTNDFWYFKIDENIISKRLFLELTATTWFDEICKKGSDGTTQRIRLQRDKFFSQKVVLPLKEEQNRLLNKLSLVKTKRKELINQIQTQKELVKQLKQCILQEAIQGKLTAEWRKQNPDVEPASELLKRIKAEKGKLIKEKKIRKEKPLPPITQEEIPFELPEGWVWCRLGEISFINGGYAFKSSQYTEQGIRVIRISDFDEKGFKDKNIVRYPFDDKISSYLLEENSILMAMTGGTVGKTYLVKSIDEEMYVNQRVAAIKIIQPIISEYISSVFKTKIVQKVIENAKNSTNDNISMSDIKGFFIPLPPIAEQKAIVEKVENLMQKVSVMEEEIQKSEQNAEMLMQAVLKEAFESKKEEVEV